MVLTRTRSANAYEAGRGSPERVATLPQERHPRETARVEAFSDGVFAIAITLLVLELRPPPLSEGEHLAAALAADWPAYLAFLTSFLIILVIWINHHNLFNLIGRSDRTFLILNGMLLLATSFVPFPTILVATHLLGPGASVAMAVYAATGVGIALAFNGIWRYASRGRRLLAPSVSDAAVSSINRVYTVGPALYGIALVLAFVHPLSSFIYCMGLGVFFAVFATIGRDPATWNGSAAVRKG